MKKNILALTLLLGISYSYAQQTVRDSSWQLVWHDEFDNPIDWNVWQSEHGFVRNHEDQWYQKENAYTKDGLLVLEAKIDSITNPRYKEGSNDWKRQKPYARYSSASINTSKSFSFQYGQMEVRARIPAVEGAWPAIWTLGNNLPWPSCGECDVMEFYHIGGKPHILANAAWGNDRQYDAVWNLALGGDNGGRISDDTFPMRYEIDYVRVWQQK